MEDNSKIVDQIIYGIRAHAEGYYQAIAYRRNRFDDRSPITDEETRHIVKCFFESRLYSEMRTRIKHETGKDPERLIREIVAAATPSIETIAKNYNEIVMSRNEEERLKKLFGE